MTKQTITLTLDTGTQTKSISVPSSIGNVLFNKLSDNDKIKYLDVLSFESMLEYCVSRSLLSGSISDEEVESTIDEIISSTVKTQSNGLNVVSMTTASMDSNNKHTNELISEMDNKGLSLIENTVTNGKNTKSVMKFKQVRYPRIYNDNIVHTPPKFTKITEDGSTLRKYIILSDIHAPYHDKKLVHNLVSFGIHNKFYGCIINGDVLDLPYFGSYEKKLDFYDQKVHAETVNEMGKLCDIIGEGFEYKLLIDGNHDQRMSRNSLGHNISGEGIKPYGSKCDLFSVGTYLGLQRHTGENEYKNFHCLPYGSSVQIGNKLTGLAIHHGDKFGKNINPDMIHMNNLYGHTHRMETKIGCRLTDDGKMVPIAEYRTGCLLDFSKDIPCMSTSIKDCWNHGFAIITEDTSSGQVFVDNILIVDGKFTYNNEVIDLYER